MKYSEFYLKEVMEIAKKMDASTIENMVEELRSLRERNGRLFFLGVGGSAANASHAVNDFRKIAGIESYAPSDNVSELTARINDDGWESVFTEWLIVSRLSRSDAVFIFSVGGGDEDRGISINIVSAVKYAKKLGAKILGVVGRDGGATAKMADLCVIVPVINSHTVTTHTEAFQSVLWHLIVSHPRLKMTEMKWESIGGKQEE